MVNVIKATGQSQPFDEEKVRRSIQRAGIPQDMREKIVNHVKTKLYENIPTSEIYHHITEFLDKNHTFAKAKYGLKQAVMALGPTGYPFEDFIAEILVHQGYQTQVRTLLRGKCVMHEIDVIAQKSSEEKVEQTTREKIMVEAKFHNVVGIHTDLHVALYTKARFDDVKNVFGFTKGMLITNTKATTDAISYALCAGLGIIGWSYPQGGSFSDLIEKSRLHPITALTSLNLAQQQTLLQHHVILCKDIVENVNVLQVLNLIHQQKQKIIDEANYIFNALEA